MSRREISEEKQAYEANVNRLLDTYEKIVFCNMDNVTSQQMHNVRRDLRGKAEILMGKKTMQRKIILRRAEAASATALDKAMKTKFVDDNLLSGNVALAFTSAPVSELNEVFLRYRNQAPARVGAVAPCDVVVAAGNTGMEPTMTSFFQALNIATKIVKGSIEIVAQVHLIKKGDKITSSAVALLSKLDIKPFFYGITALSVYENGSVYPAEVLDITQDDLLGRFMNGVSKLRALSLAAKWPSELTLGFQMASAFRKLLALSLATNYTFKESEAFLKAAATAAAAPAPAAAPAKGDDKKADKKADAKPAKAAEPEPEEDADLGMGLFD